MVTGRSDSGDKGGHLGWAFIARIIAGFMGFHSRRANLPKELALRSPLSWLDDRHAEISGPKNTKALQKS